MTRVIEMAHRIWRTDCYDRQTFIPYRVLQHWQMIADGRFEYDCRALLQMIDEVDELRLWETASDGFCKTRDEFLEKVVLIDFDLTEQSFREIVGRLRGGEEVTLPKHGGDHGNQYTGGKRQADNISLPRYGTAASYTLRRLKRDRPELAARVIAGELSANAAAIKAGWRKKKTPLEQLLHWWEKATEVEKQEFCDLLFLPPALWKRIA